MSVSRRFIVQSLKDRGIHPGLSKDYPKDIFNFLLETFNIQEDVLEEDKASKKSLEDTASAISASVKKYMKLGTSKTIRLDRILAKSSNHRVLKH